MPTDADRARVLLEQACGGDLTPDQQIAAAAVFTRLAATLPPDQEAVDELVAVEMALDDAKRAAC